MNSQERSAETQKNQDNQEVSKEIIKGDDRYYLNREGVDNVEPIERFRTLRREGHIFADGKHIIPATRGLNKPYSKRGKTFRRGGENIHPYDSSGLPDHDYHVLQEAEKETRSRGLLRKFRKKVKEIDEERKSA